MPPRTPDELKREIVRMSVSETSRVRLMHELGLHQTLLEKYEDLIHDGLMEHRRDNTYQATEAGIRWLDAI